MVARCHVILATRQWIVVASVERDTNTVSDPALQKPFFEGGDRVAQGAIATLPSSQVHPCLYRPWRNQQLSLGGWLISSLSGGAGPTGNEIQPNTRWKNAEK